MKHYRIKVRDDKSEFFEELLRYLDFLDYEQVEAFSEPRIYANFELKSQHDKSTHSKSESEKAHSRGGGQMEQEDSTAESLREVLARIDKMRDEARKNK